MSYLLSLKMENFKIHLAQFITIDDKELASILSFFEVKNVTKKENLLEENQLSQYQYFVVKGCLRKFFINEKGVEQTTQFALEHWWIADTFNFERAQRSDFFIQAVEQSTVLCIGFSNFNALLEKHSKMERYFRLIYQKVVAANEKRIRYLYEFSREESYLHFSRLFPTFIQRIPQYLIASYLGFTPEYLSEIKAKLRS